MLKKLAVAAAVMVIAGMAFTAAGATSVSAAEPTPSPSRPSTILHGEGVLDAHGTGIAAVKGSLDYTVRADEGILLVRDIGGDAQVNVVGLGGTGQWRGFTAYFGIHGAAHITGSEIAVIVVGHDMNLHVAGEGWAFLKGVGTFTANGHGPFRWTTDGAFGSVTP